MATTTVYFTGTTGYSGLDKVDQYGKYSIQLYLDKEGKRVFKESGLQLKMSEDGAINLRRPDVQRLMSGEDIDHGPPQVIDKDNNTIPKEEYGKTWTGAQVTAKCVVYDTVKGKGHRLETVRVEVPSELGENQGTVLGNIDVPF